MAFKSRMWLLMVLAPLALAGCDLFVSPQKRIERAAAAMESGDYATAVIELRNALDKAPDDVRGRVLLVEASLQVGDIPAAEKELRRAVELGAKPADVVLLDARLKQEQGQWQELSSLMAQPQEGLEEPRRLVYLGSAQLGLGQAEAALATIEQALSAQPQGSLLHDAHVAHARALAANGRSQEAMAELTAVLEAEPRHAQAALTKAALLLEQGDFATVEQTLGALPLGDPKSGISFRDTVIALGTLAEAQLAQDRIEEAKGTVGQLAKRAPGVPVLSLLRGRIALAEGDAGAAANHLQKTVQAAPDFPVARFWLAYAYVQQGKSALAEQELQRLLQENPGNVEARKLLAEAQLQAGRSEAALTSLGPVVDAGSGDPGVLSLVAQAKAMQGDVAGAEELWEQGMQAAPESVEMKLQAVAGYLRVGDRQRALDLLSTIPDEQGGQRKRFLQVMALASGKDPAVASMEIEALAKKHPDDVDLQILYGGWLGSQKQYDDAQRVFDQALKIAPDDGRVLLALSQLAARRGDDAAAKSWLEEWRKRDPKAAEPRLRLARAAFIAGDAATGTKLVNEAIGAEPDVARVQNQAGRVLLEAKRFDAALARFRAAAALEPENKVHLLDMARAQLALENREAARESLKKALLIDPNWAPAVAALAQLEVQDGRTAEALDLAARLRKSADHAAQGWAIEGDVLTAAKDPAGAANAYAKAAAIQPSSQLAVAESRARRAAGIQPAYAPLQRWLERQPSDAGVRLALALALEEAGEAQGATREYEQVLKANPNNVVALNNLAVLYQRAGDKRARNLAASAYEKAPDSGAIADTYGWILVQEGDVEQGLKILRQAHEKAKDLPEIQYHLGVALVRAGRVAEGKEALQAAVAAAGNASWKAEAERELAALPAGQ